MEQTRDITNYGALSLTALDKNTLQDFTLYAIPMRLFLFGGNLRLAVEVWDLKDDFEAGKPSNSPFNQTFELLYADAKTAFPDFFTAIESSILAWLGVAAKDYALEQFDINLTNLQVKARAQHKTRINKQISDETASLDEFQQIKADYPQLVQGYFGFAYSYFKTHDANLAKFN